MTSQNVGVLQYRDYDATLVVVEGGVVVESDGWNFYSDVLNLLRMLRTKEIDGEFYGLLRGLTCASFHS